jgi:pilus assembly protein CpaF
MSLYKRLHEAQNGGSAGGGAPVPGAPGGAPGGSGAGGHGGAPAGGDYNSHNAPAFGAAQEPRQKRDPILDALRQKIHHHVIEEIGPLLFDQRLGEDELRRRAEDELQAALNRERAPLSSGDRQRLIKDVLDDIMGYGPIDQFLKDDDVSEVMVNGPERIYVEKKGKLVLSNATFIDEQHLRRIIDKIVSQVGRRIDDSTPMVDARLLDGSRVNAVVHPLAVGGPFLTIRKFSRDPLTVDDLIRFGSFSPKVAKLLEAIVLGRTNIIVSGGTGTGKTTLLNVLSSFIPSDERIVTVEDAKELQLKQDHVLSLETRPSNVEGKGEVTIRDLVRNTLRMRPDRIVVGECRAGEALDMLQAMNTGHDGSLTTVHSNSPRDALARLETLTLMAGYDLPVRAIREQMSSAIDVIVQLTRLRDGTRRVTHITEVQGMEGDTIVLQDLFLFDYGMGVDEHGRFKGYLKAVGIRPKFSEHLADNGVKLGNDIFDPEPFAKRGGGGF